MDSSQRAAESIGMMRIADGLWIAQPFQDMRIDVVSVERHNFHTVRSGQIKPV